LTVTRGPVGAARVPCVEQLRCPSLLGRPVQPIWFEQERCFVRTAACQVVWTDPPNVPKKEHILRYGTPGAPCARVPGQLPICDDMTVEVVEGFLAADHEPNSLRSADGVRKADHQIAQTGTYFVRPVL